MPATPATDAATAMATAPALEGATPARWADWLELTKPRITGLVVVTAAVGYLLDPSAGFDLDRFLLVLLGTGLLSGGASALNQVLERDSDARMRRTANRPLPSGRLSADAALAFGGVLCLAGCGVLLVGVNALTMLLGGATVVAYVWVYTPLKRRTSLATVVGAFPGAAPPLMGWAAAHDSLGLGAWALFGLQFFWQMPHFLAIAWMYRDDYARGGFPLLTIGDEHGHRTARQCLLYGAALVPVSLLPSALGLTGTVYWAGALLLGLGVLWACARFAWSRSDAAARRLLLASVLFLPALLPVMLLDRWLGR